ILIKVITFTCFPCLFYNPIITNDCKKRCNIVGRTEERPNYPLYALLVTPSQSLLPIQGRDFAPGMFKYYLEIIIFENDETIIFTPIMSDL
uniref:hypothetical protein n=1 Tax=Salmonella sp. s55004 TaxID=3159675 RepID=UPI00397F22BC